MGGLNLILKREPKVPLEAECISPTCLMGRSINDIRKLPVLYGNTHAALGDFFNVSGKSHEGPVRIEGNLSKVKYIGAGMDRGVLSVHGPVGMHLGEGMKGGLIEVAGDVGDFAGAQMRGGTMRIHGDVGNLAGGSLIGEKRGASGGVIVIHGNAGREAGAAMSGGLLVIAGDCSDLAGAQMSGGVIVTFGQSSQRAGASMSDGTIVSLGGLKPLPTFSYDCTYRPVFMRLLWSSIERLGVSLPSRIHDARFHRYTGDSNEQGKGEILICRT